MTDIPQPNDKEIYLKDIIYFQDNNKYLTEEQINRGILKKWTELTHKC